MLIEIWSDIVCPWCYIGKRRLETALAQFAHADQVEIKWRSYLLDPSAPEVATETVLESLGRKFGSGPEGARGMLEKVTSLAAEEGMAWNYYDAMSVSTIKSHRLLHLALEEGGVTLQGRLKEALLEANFVHALNIGEDDVLTEIAVNAGLPAERVAQTLGSDEFLQDVLADVQQAQGYGASGVPFYVVDAKYGVSGAQPAEAFTQVLERAWAESQPSIQMVASGEECGPDGCAI